MKLNINHNATVLLIIVISLFPQSASLSKAAATSITGQQVAVVRYVKGQILVNKKRYAFQVNSPICAEWEITCQKDGVLEFCFNGGRYVRLTAYDKPYRVPHIARTANWPGPWKPAGREMGVAVSFYSPPKQTGVVWPIHFTFRWQRSSAKPSLRLFLREHGIPGNDNSPLWSAEHVDGSRGELTDELARQALQTLRLSKPDARVELVVIEPNEEVQVISFGLLSEQSEQQMISELQGAEGQPEPQRSLVRATAFLQRRLYTEAAEAMETASAALRESVGLRFGCIWAHRRTGNWAREKELTDHLPPGTKIPGD